MAETIKIQLSDEFQPVTEADIRTAKNYVLRRESAVHGLENIIDGLLEAAAENITILCYQFGVDPRTFQISSNYNERLYELIANILDELEADIMDYLLSYSTKCTESEKKRGFLLPWILALQNNGRNLNQIMERRIWNFSRDIEAMVIAVRMADLDRAKAISMIKSNLKTVYSMPVMKNAFAHAAEQKNTFIRNYGVKHGNRGNSNSEAVNILRTADITVQKAWMHQKYEDYKAEKYLWGYGVRRGSTFPCTSICDMHVGNWPIENAEHVPPLHGHCCCWMFPIYYKTE